MRERVGFSQLYLVYTLGKQDRQRKAQDNISQLMDRLVRRRNKVSFATIKKQFFRDNPWFHHAMEKLTVMPQCSTQIAFWKIRLLKNIGSENVSVAHSIRLKQFAEIFDKKRHKALQWAFAKIDHGRIPANPVDPSTLPGNGLTTPRSLKVER